MIIGSQPIDGGHYIFNEAARDEFLEVEPGAAPFLRPFVGAREFLQGSERWILALQDVPPNVLAQLPQVRKRMAAVRAYREASRRQSTKKLAKTPTIWQVNVLPGSPFLVIPRVSSERREYMPIGWVEPPTIPSDAVLVLEKAALADFALLTSAMHMAWMRAVAGRLGSGYRYSVGVVYNTFPVPQKGVNMASLESLAQAVLDTRAAYPEATLSDLYDPDLMPLDLRRVHTKLDRAVDRLYRKRGFDSERERIDYLFVLYEKMKSSILDES